MKSEYSKIVLMIFILFLTGCAGSNVRQSHPPDARLPEKSSDAVSHGGYQDDSRLKNFDQAVENMVDQLIVPLESLDSPSGHETGFFIFNKSVVDRKETELDRMFIDRLIGSLASRGRGIRIKRKELATFHTAATGERRINCPEVLETITPDYLIEYSRNNCPDSSDFPECTEVQAAVMGKGSNRIIFTKSVSFLLRGAVARWAITPYFLPEISEKQEFP